MGLFGSGRPKPPAQIAMGDEWQNSFVPMEQPQQPAQSQRWMDGGKFTGKDAFGLALAAIGDVAAMQGGRQATGLSSITQSMAGAREAQQKAQLAAQQAQEQRLQGREEYAWKAQYDAANPGPSDDVFTQSMRAAGIDPTTPEAQSLYRSRVQSMADPIVNIPLPGGQVYMGPRSRAPGSVPQAPTAPVGRLTPLTGGGAGNGASNFPSGNPLQRPW